MLAGQPPTTLHLAAARSDLRELLAMLRDGLGQPPLSAKFRLTMETLLDMLGEQDLGKRLAAREHISACLADTGASSPTRCQRPRPPAGPLAYPGFTAHRPG